MGTQNGVATCVLLTGVCLLACADPACPRRLCYPAAMFLLSAQLDRPGSYSVEGALDGEEFDCHIELGSADLDWDCSNPSVTFSGRGERVETDTIRTEGAATGIDMLRAKGIYETITFTIRHDARVLATVDAAPVYDDVHLDGDQCSPCMAATIPVEVTTP